MREQVYLPLADLISMIVCFTPRFYSQAKRTGHSRKAFYASHHTKRRMPETGNHTAYMNMDDILFPTLLVGRIPEAWVYQRYKEGSLSRNTAQQTTRLRSKRRVNIMTA